MDIERERIVELYSQRASILEHEERVKLLERQRKKGGVERRLVGELSHFEQTKRALRRESLQCHDPVRQRGSIAFMAEKLKKSGATRAALEGDLVTIKREVAALTEGIVLQRTRKDESMAMVGRSRDAVHRSQEEGEMDALSEAYSLTVREKEEGAAINEIQLLDNVCVVTRGGYECSELYELSQRNTLEGSSQPVIGQFTHLPEREDRRPGREETPENPEPRNADARFSLARHAETVSSLESFTRGGEEGLHLTYHHRSGGEFQLTVTDDSVGVSIEIDSSQGGERGTLRGTRAEMEAALVARGVPVKHLLIRGEK